MAPPRDTADNVSDNANKLELLEPVQVLAEKGIKEVPPSFVQHIEEPVAEGGDAIPVIDMSEIILGTNKESALRKLASACEEWGLFQVINHGIPEQLVNSMKEVCTKFFQMPLKEKQRWAKEPGDNRDGYGRYNSSSDSVFDWVDIIGLYVAPPALRNMSKWPTEPSAFREVTEEYISEMQKFIESLLAAICETLGLPPDHIKDLSGDYSSVLRVNYYPPCPQPDKALGVSSHSDAGTITVLTEHGDCGGLQVRKDGKWVSVKGMPNALIVNAGDMLQVISNGKYKSVDHRAVVNTKSDRISIVVFSSPAINSSTQVSPAKQLVTEASPALYRSITYLDYLTYYFNSKAPGRARVDSLLIEDKP